MLIGPRMHDGNDGYLVITPLEREGKGTTVLVNRGWIPKKFKAQKKRPDGLPSGMVTVEGLLREPWKKNMFTPDNSPQTKEFYFPDVLQMAQLTGSQPVWIEETMGKYYPSCGLARLLMRISQSPICSNPGIERPEAFQSEDQQKLISGTIMLNTYSRGIYIPFPLTPPS